MFSLKLNKSERRDLRLKQIITEPALLKPKVTIKDAGADQEQPTV